MISSIFFFLLLFRKWMDRLLDMLFLLYTQLICMATNKQASCYLVRVLDPAKSRCILLNKCTYMCITKEI